MRIKNYFLFLICIFVLLSCTTNSLRLSSVSSEERQTVTLIPKEILHKAIPAIFEVIVPKMEDKNLEYEKVLPFDRLPYHERNDHYLSIGTAFAIDKNRFISASHVFSFQLKKPWVDFFLRDQSGEVFKINKIFRYSNYRDLIEFSLEKASFKFTPLTLSENSEMGDTVYVLGNALGEGISFRAGQISSFTPEEKNNQWKFIRFSAPASPGNSGGPLLNDKGEVIGVVVRKNASENLNYAVPVKELKSISDSNAEFSLPNIPLIHDYVKESIDLSFKLPLPEAPFMLGTLAEEKISYLYREAISKLYNLNDERFFPASANFREYITHQPAPRYEISFIYPGKDNIWASFNPKPTYTFGSEGKIITEMIRYQHNVLINIRKPKNQLLKDFIGNSKLFGETVLKELHYVRTVGGEKIPVTSLGKATRQVEWVDDLGRLWINYYWQINSMNSFLSLDCLPVPRGVVCNINLNQLYASTFSSPAFIKSFVDRILVQYMGQVTDWQEFLVLDVKYRPDILKKMQIKLDDKKELKINAGGASLLFDNEKVNNSTDILVRLRYSPSTNFALDIQDIEISFGKKYQQYFKISSLLEPFKNSSEEVKRRWDDIKSHTGEFDGKIQMKKGFGNKRVYISEEIKNHEASPSVIHYVLCGDKLDSIEKILEDCQHFRDLNLNH